MKKIILLSLMISGALYAGENSSAAAAAELAQARARYYDLYQGFRDQAHITVAVNMSRNFLRWKCEGKCAHPTPREALIFAGVRLPPKGYPDSGKIIACRAKFRLFLGTLDDQEKVSELEKQKEDMRATLLGTMVEPTDVQKVEVYEKVFADLTKDASPDCLEEFAQIDSLFPPEGKVDILKMYEEWSSQDIRPSCSRCRSDESNHGTAGSPGAAAAGGDKQSLAVCK